MESPPARFAASRRDAAFLSLTRAMPRRSASSYAEVPARDEAASTSCGEKVGCRSVSAIKIEFRLIPDPYSQAIPPDFGPIPGG